MIARLKGLPLVWQTLLLAAASVAIAQAIGFVLLVASPPPRPDFNRMTDIAAALAGTDPGDRGDRGDRGDHERELQVHRQADVPVAGRQMISDPGLVHALADRLGVGDGDVRLWFKPDRPVSSGIFTTRHRPSVSMRGGEQMFFTPIVAGLRADGGWVVAATPPPPFILPWQRRMLLWFALSAVALIPLAWMFARALTKPIRRFADAANRLGADPNGPPVSEEEGPAELRVTARALNRMQGRLADYVGERTAMIGAIAHDLRTPLARIAFRIEGAPDPVRDKVLADVEQMRAMLAATIGFVKNTGAGEMRVAVDIGALLASLVEQERELGRPVVGGPIVAATVLGDPIALERLFQNLIDNGIAYGGGVTIASSLQQDAVVVTIADDGPGLSDDMLTRAFQPFVRGDPSRNRNTGGIGLGLTIARTIAENHGGTLSLTNGRPKGLVASCRLPLAS